MASIVLWVCGNYMQVGFSDVLYPKISVRALSAGLFPCVGRNQNMQSQSKHALDNNDCDKDRSFDLVVMNATAITVLLHFLHSSLLLPFPVVHAIYAPISRCSGAFAASMLMIAMKSMKTS